MAPQTAKQTLLLCLILPYAFAQRSGYEVKDWQKNRFFFWSADAPMTKALDKFPEVVNGAEMILHHFQRVHDQVIAHVGRQIPPGVNVKPCLSVDQVSWPRAVRASFGILGFPEADFSCITDFTGVQLTRHERPPYSLNQLYQAIFKRGAAIRNNAKSIASTFIDVTTNYTGPDFNFNYPYDTVPLKCVLHPVNAVRVNGRWRLATGILNRPILETLPLLRRKNIIEYHGVADGHLTDNLQMRMPVFPESGTKRVIRDDATTFIFNGRGPTNPSMYRNIPIPENPAILESLDSANVYVQQAQDAVSPSNIAILVLPLALNIVPITLFADVSTMKMLLYLILTDMLTVIPLLIKGIELIQIQTQKHRAIVTRVSSSFNSTIANSAAGELWASECQAKENIRATGVVFVILSVVFLVGGVLLELVTRHYLLKRNRQFKPAKIGGWSSSSSRSSTESEATRWSSLGARDPSDFSDDYRTSVYSYSAEDYFQEEGRNR